MCLCMDIERGHDAECKGHVCLAPLACALAVALFV